MATTDRSPRAPDHRLGGGWPYTRTCS